MLTVSELRRSASRSMRWKRRPTVEAEVGLEGWDAVGAALWCDRRAHVCSGWASRWTGTKLAKGIRAA